MAYTALAWRRAVKTEFTVVEIRDGTGRDFRDPTRPVSVSGRNERTKRRFACEFGILKICKSYDGIRIIFLLDYGIK